MDPVSPRYRAGDHLGEPWLTPQLWLAQFAITDLSKGSHQRDERTSRQGPGLAGASGGQYWLKSGCWPLRKITLSATLKVQSKAGTLICR